MKAPLILTFTFICFVLVHNQCIISNPGPITLDQGTAVVCMHLFSNFNNTETYNSSFAFKLDVDYFEAIVLNGLANFTRDQISLNAQSVSVVLQFQNTAEIANITMEIYNRAGLRYRDILSFIIIVNEGNFNQLRADNQKCDNLLDGSICNNGEAYSQTSANGTFTSAEPRLFVSWMGSDLDKNHFISHTRRLSRFSAFSVGSIYNDAKNVITA